MRLVPVAEESLGVRSMCFYVETKDVRILLDPGVSLAPWRYGKPPHPLEFKALRECRRRISRYARKAEVVTVSHYHLDHYTPPFKSWFEWCDEESFREVYEGKVVLMKDFRRRINLNQMKRGYIFHKRVSEVASEVRIVDGATLRRGETVLRFSEPIPHGAEGSALGWVLSLLVSEGDEKLIYAPDVQGPASREGLEFTLSEDVGVVIMGGPPTYLMGYRVKEDIVRKGLSNLLEVLRRAKLVIIGHHLLRDPLWRLKVKSAERGGELVTAAGYLGFSDNLLEAYRDRLYEELPPKEGYEKWFKLPRGRRTGPPPLED